MAQENNKTPVPLEEVFNGNGIKVSRNGSEITINVSDLPKANVTVITNENGKVTKLVPVEEQTNTRSMTSSSPTAKAFNSALAAVVVGDVQVCKLSPYLSDISDKVYAKLLVAPQYTHTIFGRGLGTFYRDTDSIRKINERHGIHHDGQCLMGMDIYDRPDYAPHVSYEEAWAMRVREVFNKVKKSGERGITELALPTKEIVHGRGADGPDLKNNLTQKIRIFNTARMPDLIVENNLFSNVAKINAKLAEQGAQEITTSKKCEGDPSHLLLTASDGRKNGSQMYVVNMEKKGYCGLFGKGDPGAALGVASRAIALQFSPPYPS